ncbi:hypothetical protein [Novosphingobium lentum]|uniref:hypothetical protein n=1 Tax=Novosphingobium lentum TaxID=145287 RepID=UPI000AB1F910|nr:hypothetical protein [Novosphingobium lentum]
MKDPAMPILPVPIFAQAATVLQPGPNPSPMRPSDLPIPHRHKVAPGTDTQAPLVAPAGKDRLAECMALAGRDPAAGEAYARAWLADSKPGLAQVGPNQCLGQIRAAGGDWAGAEQAFAAAIAAIPASQASSAQPLLGMAGNAALFGGHADRAIGLLDRALALKGPFDNLQLGALQADRARALVALGRLGDAGDALDEAHRLAPEDGEGWLLSATLARRNNDLERAQRDIEVAARLAPRDPAVGLEAGVIAALAGHDEPARKSWQSVIAAAPGTPEAASAKTYLEQLGPAPVGAPVTPSKP